ncbi:interleukin-18 receptor accessory protein-like isoform X2 [Betta splendens]|uniref:Interleukin-18 receptor accessory protein-like isoform X2 n=1 Tax=Betta splendens TaxID=158456 RepID=A0A6P7M2F0_BETSP|nr:interleukin-18 receptor accessory protein-like isoform X2 [Betta splendens]
MQTEFILICFFMPVFSEGCCAGNQKKTNSDFQQDRTNLHYRAVEGETFMVPCLGFRAGECTTGNKGLPLNCGKAFTAHAKHSGNYTCDTGGSQIFFFLQVLDKDSLGCFHTKESSVILLISAGGTIPCPGQDCGNSKHMSRTIWYKGNKPMSAQNRAYCVENRTLHLCQVSDLDHGVYFCDRNVIEEGIEWTFRRAVQVTVTPNLIAPYPPTIVEPDNYTSKEVELGQAYTLTCKIYFPVEVNILYNVKWFMNYNGNTKNVITLHMEKPQLDRRTFENEVIQKAVINDVTEQHLNHTYTCFASNTAGNSSATIELKKVIKVKWPSLIGYPFVGLLVITGVGVVLHVKWLELQLFYRSHMQDGKHDEDEKEFDVFVSYVWSPVSAVKADVTGPDTDETARLSGTLTSKEQSETHTPLAVLLPHVLEDEWGYRLFMLERDVLPGGAYTNDVVLAIQRSRMLICVLSSDYLCDSNAVFILETGIKALLQNSVPKLLLIWTSSTSTRLIQTDPPLPRVVQRGLKVLPTLNWTSGNLSGEANHSFWKCLRNAMPSRQNHCFRQSDCQW